MNKRPTMVIADDHPLLREGLRAHFAGGGGFSVVGTVGDAQAAVNLCRQHRPDMLLLDVEMPGRDSLSAMTDVKSASPGTRIVILTAYCRDTIIDIAVGGGAAGYLLKSDAPAEIFDAVARALGGERVYSKDVKARMSALEAKPRQGLTGITLLSRLTPRELEVLRYIGRGQSNADMAAAMHLSIRTVERHVSRLMEAVAIHDRAGLMHFAHEQRLVA